MTGSIPTPTGVSGAFSAIDANASWENRSLGRIRRLNEAARAQYLASREARRDVTISLIAQAAQDYFQLPALDRHLQIARDSTNSFGESVKIFNKRLRGRWLLPAALLLDGPLFSRPVSIPSPKQSNVNNSETSQQVCSLAISFRRRPGQPKTQSNK